MLSEHSSVVPINEPLIGLYFGPFLADLPGWDGSALGADNFTIRRVQEEQRQQFFAREFTDVTHPALRRMLRARFMEHAVRYPPEASVGTTRVVVKEPSGSQSADLLLAATPSSHLLFLLRDGRDVVDSELAANLNGSWVGRQFPGSRGVSESERLAFVEQSARKWLWRTEVVQEAFSAHPGPKRMVKYEQLLEQPRQHLTGILEWMGLPASAGEIDDVLEKHSFDQIPKDQRGQDHFFRSASPGSWRERLTDDERASLHGILGTKLEELGYEL